jgi:hypothetical protein
MQASAYEKKVKLPHYRPEQALRVPGGSGSQISRQLAHEGGKVVSRTHRLPLPSRKCSWYSFILEAELTPRPKCSWKNYVGYYAISVISVKIQVWMMGQFFSDLTLFL